MRQSLDTSIRITDYPPRQFSGAQRISKANTASSERLGRDELKGHMRGFKLSEHDAP